MDVLTRAGAYRRKPPNVTSSDSDEIQINIPLRDGVYYVNFLIALKDFGWKVTGGVFSVVSSHYIWQNINVVSTWPQDHTAFSTAKVLCVTSFGILQMLYGVSGVGPVL